MQVDKSSIGGCSLLIGDKEKTSSEEILVEIGNIRLLAGGVLNVVANSVSPQRQATSLADWR